MAGVKKNLDPKNHALAVAADDPKGELFIVRGGPRTYLWIGPKGHGECHTFSGPATLRAIANAILTELGKK